MQHHLSCGKDQDTELNTILVGEPGHSAKDHLSWGKDLYTELKTVCPWEEQDTELLTICPEERTWTLNSRLTVLGKNRTLN